MSDIDFMKKTKTQEARKQDIKTELLQSDGKTAYLPEEGILYDEMQMHDDVVKLGEKKTWKPSEDQVKRNEKIAAAQNLTKSATADTLMVHGIIKESLEWHMDSDHAMRLLLATEFKSSMLTSANIRSHFGEYMQIVRCIELVKKELGRVDQYNYGQRLEPMLADLDIFYDRMKAFAEKNRIRLDGSVMGENEEATEFTLDRAKILSGEVFKNQRADDYDFGELKNLNVEELKKTLAEEDKTEKYDGKEAFQDVMMKDRHMGYKLHYYRGDIKAQRKYDTAQARIAEIKEMRAQIRFLENVRDEKGILKKQYDFASDKRKLAKFHREELELKARLNLAEAEARLALATENWDQDKMKEAEAMVREAWDDYKRVQIRLAKETMPLTSSGTDTGLMCKSEAITSASDMKNYEYKKDILAEAGKLDESIPQLKKVKNLAIAYARETHYTIGCDEEAELLGELYKAMKEATEAGFDDEMAGFELIKSNLNYSTIGDFNDIPKELKLDFSDKKLKENGKFKDGGHIRNAFMNNDIMRKWVDVKDVPIFPHEPTVNDLRQGKVSNCYMLAATTSLVQHDPSAIKHCIRDNGDGTATVRLYKGPGQPVFIRVKKEVPRLAATGGAILTSGPLWMQLIEMAAAHVGMFNTEGKTGVGTLWYGTGAMWFGMLTGVFENEMMMSDNDGKPAFVGSAANADALFEEIKKAKDNNVIFHMGTKSSTSSGLNSGHAYTVLGAKTIGTKKYITLRNPYANMSYQRDENGEVTKSSSYFSSVADATQGQFDIPLAEFIANAKSITKTNVGKDSPFYFNDEKADLKDVAKNGGKVPGTPGLNEEQIKLLNDMNDEDDPFGDM